MTSREGMQALFEGRTCDEPVVCLHTWGRYPFELLGKERFWESSEPDVVAEVYEEFWRMFPCDWIQVREGFSSVPPPAGIPPAAPLTPEDVDAWIEGNWDVQTLSRRQVHECGMYGHVGILADRVGGDVPIVPNQGAPGSGFPGLSWEDQLILVQQQPALVEHFVRADDRRFLERVYASQDCGADGYIFSEGYDGAVDLISPVLFEQVFLEAKHEFYADVRQAGMWGIGYFLGGIMPYLETINRIRPDGVMIEESKKGFVLDPLEIRKKLDPDIVLFGNIDSYLLLTGTPEQIRSEVARHARAREYGRFAFINGSPICPGTPPDNLRVFLDAARESAA